MHIPGEEGVPESCTIVSNAWNFLNIGQARARGYEKILNSMVANEVIAAIATKRNINPVHLNYLGLPKITDEAERLLRNATFTEVQAIDEATALVDKCAWISQNEKNEIKQLWGQH